MYKKNISVLLAILFFQSSFILNGQLMNGDFEEGSSGFPFYWTVQSWKSEGLEILWEQGTGINGSRCISLNNTIPNDSRFLQTIELEPYTSYMLEGWVKGENIVNHQAGFIYANISAMVEWDYKNSPSGTFDWTELSFCFTTDSTGAAQIGLRLGYFGNVVTGKAWFDNFTLQKTDSLCGLKINEGLHIKTLLEEDDLEVITEQNMNRWLAHLDSCYEKYHELVGFVPYDGKDIEILSVEDYPGGWAVAGNPIKWYQPWIKQELITINNLDNWSFGIMHEISHDFDDPSWNFYAEHFANFKLYYAAEKLNSKIVLSGITYEGTEIKSVFEEDYFDRLNSYYNEGSITRFRDGLTYRFICIKDSIGWEPFRKAFRSCRQENFTGWTIEKYVNFLDKLSIYSGQDVRKYMPKLDRDLFVKSMGGVSLPFSPDSLKVTERNCNHTQLSWINIDTDIRAVEIERRTANTWYKPLDFINYDQVECNRYEEWKDYHINEDSIYYYRIKAYVTTGPSAYTLETKSEPFPRSETPSISEPVINICQHEELNLVYSNDTVVEGITSFFVLDNSMNNDTLFYTQYENEFNKQLWFDINFDNEFNQSNTYLRLFGEFQNGYWNFTLDSVSSTLYPDDSIYEFSFHDYEPQFHSWIMKINNNASLEKLENKINLQPDSAFFGKIRVIFRSSNTCSYCPSADTLVINVTEKWVSPGPIQGKTVYCQGEKMKFYHDNLSEGQHVGWGYVSFPVQIEKIVNDTFILQPKNDYHGNFMLMSYTEGNCGVDFYYDTIEVRIIQNPDLKINLLENINNCYGDSVHLTMDVEEGLNTNWIFPEGNLINSNDTILAPLDENTLLDIFISDQFGCHSDTGSIQINIIKVDADFSADKNVINVNETVQLINLSENADSFIWFPGNTFTTNIFEPAISYPDPSIYSIALKAVHSESLCSDSIMKKDFITVLDSSVLIPDMAAEGLKIFPNPAENELFIRIDNPSISVQCLDLYSIKGERLKTIIPDSDIVRFKLQNYPSGTYLLVVKLQKGIKYYRILKR